MYIYNTMTRRKEELKPITPGTVKIYCCGPTVYNLIHIGNARALCVFDTLRRYLEFRGYKVLYVQNFTDVDDKIIRKANELGKTASEVSENAIKEYFRRAQELKSATRSATPWILQFGRLQSPASLTGILLSERDVPAGTSSALQCPVTISATLSISTAAAPILSSRITRTRSHRASALQVSRLQTSGCITEC